MATSQQQSDLLDALTDAQIASGATPAEFAAYVGALAGAALAASLQPADVAAIVSVGGITTKISAINAQIEKKQDERDTANATIDSAVTTLNNQRAALQAQLKAAVGG